MHTSHNSMFLFKNNLQQQIRSIPKKNKAKFQTELLTLIEKAHEDNYDEIEYF